MYVDEVTQKLILDNEYADVLVILRTMAKRLQLKNIKLLSVAIDKGECDPADLECKLICGDEALQALIDWAIGKDIHKEKYEPKPEDLSGFRQRPPPLIVGNDLSKENYAPIASEPNTS